MSSAAGAGEPVSGELNVSEPCSSGKSDVSNSGTVNFLDICVARRIVHLRKEKGLTQARLAHLCGISAAYLSRVESNQSSLTLSGLAKVAAALEIPVTSLLDEEAAVAPLSLHRPSDEWEMVRSRGYAYQLLAADKKGKLMEPMLIEILPEPGPQRQWSHAGEEFAYLLQGSCMFFYGREQFTMNAGDAVYFDSSVSHGMARAGEGRALMLIVFTARNYLFHGDIRRLVGLEETGEV